LMLVVIAKFPPVRGGKDEEFREWFSWTNKEFANCKGFIGRRLLRSARDGTYAAIMEHESQETFVAMGKSFAHAEAGRRAALLFDGQPKVQFYEVIS